MNDDLYEYVLATLQTVPVFREWQTLYDLISDVGTTTPPDWQLPLVACRAVGAHEHNAYPAVAALAVLQTAIIWVDDMLDQDPRGIYHRYGTGATANMASALFMAGMSVIRQNVVSIELQLQVLAALETMVAVTALGQEQDLRVPHSELEYWQMVRSKSVPFYSTALYIGALFGGASTTIAEQVRKFGILYGEIVQISDDLHDSLEVPANPDWLQGRASLPLLFAEIVRHPERDHFLQLRLNSADINSLQEAQAILLRCGAVSYCIDQIWRRYEQGKILLGSAKLPVFQEMDSLLEATVLPIRDLFAMLDANLLVQPYKF